MIIIKWFLFLLFITGLLSISFFSLEHLNTVYVQVNNAFVRFGIILIFIFTILIVLRYLFLIFFSLLHLIQRSALNHDDKNQYAMVTIIVPCYNEEEVLVASLNSLINQDYIHFEILVVDDGSSDSTNELASTLEYNNGLHSLRVLHKNNSGKSYALNYGIKQAKGDLICCVDADSKLKPNAISLLVQHFKDPKIAAVAGSVLVVNRTSILTQLQALEYIQGLNLVRNGQAFLKLVNIIPGPIGMFRKSALRDVGYYDHDTFAEDCDVTLKLIGQNYKIDFEPDAISYTEAPENILELLKQRYRWTRGILQSIRKHRQYLWNWRKKTTMTFVMWYMLFESVLWPFIQLWTELFILYLAISMGMSELLLFWWILFTVLDIAGAFYSILVTKEDLRLALYAIIYRLFFINVINIAKVFATIEEWFNVDMSWGKLERKGRI